jgi:pimeloyl-ACP methyl ester carboxylesterase
MRTSISIPARQRIALAVASVIAAIAVSNVNAQHAPRPGDRRSQMQDVLTAIDTSAPATAVDAEGMLALLEAAEADGLSATDRRAAMTALYRELWQFRGFDVEAEEAAINAAAATAAGMFNAGARFSLDTHAPPPGAPEGHVAIVKRGRGPVPILLVSDLGIPGEELYDGFMARNADRYTMYAVTLPGFGSARVPPRPAVMDFSRLPWLNAAERQMREFLKAENLREVVVIGTAAGGYFSAVLAARHPARIRAAVVVNGLVHAPLRALSDPTRPVDRAERLQRARSAVPIELRPALWPPASREAYGALIDNPPPRTLWTNVMAYAARDAGRTRAWTLDHLSAANIWRQTRYSGELAATDLTDDLLALQRPLLVIASLHDHLSPGVGVPIEAQWTALKLQNPNVPVTIATFGDVRITRASMHPPGSMRRSSASWLARRSQARRTAPPPRSPALSARPAFTSGLLRCVSSTSGPPSTIAKSGADWSPTTNSGVRVPMRRR